MKNALKTPKTTGKKTVHNAKNTRTREKVPFCGKSECKQEKPKENSNKHKKATKKA